MDTLKSEIKNTQAEQDLSASLITEGDDLLTQRDLSGAEKAYQESLSIMNNLTAADPTNTKWQIGLILSQVSLGDVLLLKGNYQQSTHHYLSAKHVSFNLKAQNPTDSHLKRLALITNLVSYLPKICPVPLRLALALAFILCLITSRKFYLIGGWYWLIIIPIELLSYIIWVLLIIPTIYKWKLRHNPKPWRIASFLARLKQKCFKRF